jgi:hypothetical protein
MATGRQTSANSCFTSSAPPSPAPRDGPGTGGSTGSSPAGSSSRVPVLGKVGWRSTTTSARGDQRSVNPDGEGLDPPTRIAREPPRKQKPRP